MNIDYKTLKYLFKEWSEDYSGYRSRVDLNNVEISQYGFQQKTEKPYLEAKLENTGNLNNFIPDGVVLVNFWASYCGPCKDDIPLFRNILPKRKVKFIAIQTDHSDELDDASWLVSSALNGHISKTEKAYILSKKHKLPAVPLNALYINRKLVVKAVSFGGYEGFLNEFLDEYVKKEDLAKSSSIKNSSSASAQMTQPFKPGDKVLFTKTNEVFVVKQIRTDGKVQIFWNDENKIYTVDISKLKKI